MLTKSWFMSISRKDNLNNKTQNFHLADVAVTWAWSHLRWVNRERARLAKSTPWNA